MEEGDSRFMEQEAIKTCEIRAESFLKTKLPSDFFIMKLRQTKYYTNVMNLSMEHTALDESMNFTTTSHIAYALTMGLLSVGSTISFQLPASSMRVASWPPEEWTPKMVSDGITNYSAVRLFT